MVFFSLSAVRVVTILIGGEYTQTLTALTEYLRTSNWKLLTYDCLNAAFQWEI